MLTTTEMAKQLGITSDKLAEYARQGLVPCVRLPTGHYRFDPDEVIETLRVRQTASES